MSFEFGFVTVPKEDFSNFISEVNPKDAFSADWFEEEQHLEISFINEDDFNKAQAWIYSYFGEDIYHNDLLQASISYDEKEGYYWYCNITKKERSGFTNPVSAYDDCIEYLDTLNYTKEDYLKSLQN